MCRFSRFILLLSSVRTLVSISVFINALSLLKYWVPQGCEISCNLVKQLGFRLLPFRVGLSLAPAAFTKKVAVILC